MERSNQRSRRKLVVFASIAVVLIGLGAGGAISLASHSKTNTQATNKPIKATTTSTASASQYKLAACTSAATQTVGNASYLVGTDIAPGNYKVVSQTGDTGWTNINIYSSKANYDKQGDPTNEQGNPSVSLSPQNGNPTVTKLSDGQYMVIDADPATFTCE